MQFGVSIFNFDQPSICSAKNNFKRKKAHIPTGARVLSLLSCIWNKNQQCASIVLSQSEHWNHHIKYSSGLFGFQVKDAMGPVLWHILSLNNHISEKFAILWHDTAVWFGWALSLSNCTHFLCRVMVHLNCIQLKDSLLYSNFVPYELLRLLSLWRILEMELGPQQKTPIVFPLLHFATSSNRSFHWGRPINSLEFSAWYLSPIIFF